MDKVIYRKNTGKKRGYPLLTLSAVLMFGLWARRPLRRST